MPHAATCMDREMVTPSDPDWERQISHDMTYTQNPKMIQTYKGKNDTNELIYETDSEFENRLWLPWGKGSRNKLGIWHQQIL